ncbi:hypothetical protein DL771_003215 [Monosporascus sp. 5C6A]|nr:hypothetical protein DL771_003215 [Monosporascus sp. 5C6A]
MRSILFLNFSRVATEDGMIRKGDYSKYILDIYRMGHNYIYLYEKTGEEKYKSAAGIVQRMYALYRRSPQGGFWGAEFMKTAKGSRLSLLTGFLGFGKKGMLVYNSTVAEYSLLDKA